MAGEVYKKKLEVPETTEGPKGPEGPGSYGRPIWDKIRSSIPKAEGGGNLSAVGEDPVYRKKVYTFLKSELGDFKLSEDEFYKKLDTDQGYAPRVYKFLKNNFTGFSKPEQDFLFLMTPSKKKEETGQLPSTTVQQPSTGVPQTGGVGTSPSTSISQSQLPPKTGKKATSLIIEPSISGGVIVEPNGGQPRFQTFKTDEGYEISTRDPLGNFRTRAFARRDAQAADYIPGTVVKDFIGPSEERELDPSELKAEQARENDYNNVVALYKTDPTYSLGHLSKVFNKTPAELLSLTHKQIDDLQQSMYTSAEAEAWDAAGRPELPGGQGWRRKQLEEALRLGVGGPNETDRASFETLKKIVSTRRLLDPSKWLLISGDQYSTGISPNSFDRNIIEKSAIAYAAENNPDLKNLISSLSRTATLANQQTGKTFTRSLYPDPSAFEDYPGLMGQMVYNFLFDPLNEAVAKDSPVAAQFQQAKSNFLKDYKEFAASIVGNKISQAYEKSGKRGVLSRIAQMDTPGLRRELDETAAQLLASGEISQDEYDIYQSDVRGNEKYLDVPSILEDVSHGISGVWDGIGRTFTEPSKPVTQTQLENWEEEITNISANPTGFWKYANKAGHMIGFVGAMAAGGELLGAGTAFAEGATGAAAGAYGSQTALNVANTGLVFFGDNLRSAKLKYPDDPVKAYASAGFNTALFMALAKDLFPVKQVQGALRTVAPEVDVIVNKLANGAITREVAKQQMTNVLTKTFQVLKAGGAQNLKAASEMTAIAAANRGFDMLMGAKDFEKHHPGDELVNTFIDMFLSNVGVAGWAGYGKMRYQNRAPIEGYYDVASRPDFYRQKVESSVGSVEAKKEILENIEFAQTLKRELDALGMSPSRQKVYIANALAQKAMLAKKSADPNLQKKNQEDAAEIQAEQTELLKNPGEEVDVTDQGFTPAKEEPLIPELKIEPERVSEEQVVRPQEEPVIPELVIEPEKITEEQVVRPPAEQPEQPAQPVKAGEVALERTDADIEKRMSEIERSQEEADMQEFNALEREMEKRERDSVFGVTLDKVNEAVDALISKDKEMPNGYGAFIDRRDARETKSVANRYLKASELTDSEVIKDFTDAVMGNPDTWYADGLRLRESLKEAANRGIETQTMVNKIVDRFVKDGYTETEAKAVVARRLAPIFEGSKKAAPEVPAAETPRYSDSQVPSKREVFKVTDADGNVVEYRATTRLDGKTEWEEKRQDDTDFKETKLKFNTVKDFIDVYGKDFKVEKSSEEGYEKIMNPKLYERLTEDQKKRLNEGGVKPEVPQPTEQKFTVQDLKDNPERVTQSEQSVGYPESFAGVGTDRATLARENFTIDPNSIKIGDEVSLSGQRYAVASFPFKDKVSLIRIDAEGNLLRNRDLAEVAKAEKAMNEKEERNLRQRALNIEPTDARGIVLQYFIKGGKINPSSIKELFGGITENAAKIRAERRTQKGNVSKSTGEQKTMKFLTSKDARTIDELAHDLWENSGLENVDTRDFRNAIEEVLGSHKGTVSMAEELVRTNDADYMSMLNDQERARIGEEVHKEFQRIAAGIPEGIRNDILRILDKYRDKDGFVDWRAVEEATNGFDGDILDLSQESSKFLNDAVKEVKQTGRFSGVPGEVLPEKPGPGAEAKPTEAGAKPKKPKGKYESQAEQWAQKILDTELPSWLKGAKLPPGTQKMGPSLPSEQAIKKALANAVIKMGKLLDRGVEFSQAVKEATRNLVKLMGEDKAEDIRNNFTDYYKQKNAIQEPTAGEVPIQPKAGAGEKVEGGVSGAEPQKPPKEGKAKGQEKEITIERKKAFLNAIIEAKGTPEAAREGLKAKGLSYKTKSQKEAAELASSIVESQGIDAAVEFANKETLDGDVNALIVMKALEKLSDLEASSSTSPADKQKYAIRFAEIADEFDNHARSKGRFNSAIAYFYKKSPLGIVINENNKRQKEFDEWASGGTISGETREQDWERFYGNIEEIIKNPEVARIINERVAQGIAEAKAKADTKAGDTLRKFAAVIKKGRISKLGGFKSTTGFDAVWDKSLEVVATALEGSASLVDAIEAGLKYIRSTDWYANLTNKSEFDDKFREHWENEYSKENANQKKAEKYLNGLKQRLNGLSAKERDQVVKKVFKKIVESGGLDYQEFRDIIGEVTQRGPLTEAQAQKMKELVEKTNSIEDAAKRMQEERSPESIKAYRVAQLESSKAAAELHEMLDKNPNILNRLTSIMQLNTLGIPALINNPIYNIWNQSAVRFPVGVVNTFLDQSLAKAFQAVGKNYVPETNVFDARVQAEFFKKLGLGAKESGRQFITGLSREDYLQKDFGQQRIRPFEAWKSMIRALRGKEKLTRVQALDKALQGTVGLPAEIVARTLNLGDKPMRFAAEAATASMFARTLGLEDLDYQIFLEFPREEAYRTLKKQGFSEKEASERADYIKEAIIKEGKRSTFQQDNFLNDLLNRVFKGGGGNFAKSVLVSPYIKIPANAYWSYYNLVNPEIGVLQSLAYGGAAAAAKMKGENVQSKMYAREARYWFAHAAVGVATRAVIIALVRQGVFNTGYDKDETKKERGAEAYYSKAGTLNIDKLATVLRGGNPDEVDGGMLIPLKYFGHFGTIGNSIAKKYENMTEDQRQAQLRFWDAAWGGQELDAVQEMQEGIFANSSALLSALQDESGNGFKRYGLNIMNLLTNIVQPATAAQVEKALLPYQSTTKADNFIDELKNNYLQRMWIYRKLSGKEPPARVGIWGDRVEKKDNFANFAMRWFGVSQQNKDAFAYPIWRLYEKTGDRNFLPQTIPNTLNDQKLTTEQLTRLEELIGQERRERVAPFVNNISFIEGFDKGFMRRYMSKTGQAAAAADDNKPVYFKDLDDDNKKFALNYLYDLGRIDGLYKFYLAYPELDPKNEYRNELDEELKERRAAFREANYYKGRSEAQLQKMEEDRFKK